MLVMKNMPGISKEGGYFYSRPRSFFVEPNEFGVFLVFAYGYIFAEYYSMIRIVNRRMLLGLLLLIFILIIPNMSRGSWIGMLVATGIVVIYEHRARIRQLNVMRMTRLIVFSTVLLVSLLFIISKVVPTKWNTTVSQIIFIRMGDLLKGNDPTYLIRKESNKIAIEAMIQKPLTGIGIGSIFTLYDKKNQNMNTTVIREATSSNFVSDVAAETGVPGIGALLMFIVSIFLAVTFTIKCIADKEIQVIFIGALASFTGLIVNGMTYAVHMLPFMWISAGILCGMGLYRKTMRNKLDKIG
jgi:O-antigen ligase